MSWTPALLPDLSGKTYVITGGNGGLGLAAAKILAGKRGRIVITARDVRKAAAALDELRRSVQAADADFVLLDLAEPASIRDAVATLHEKCARIDAIINNAGVMQTPEIRTSEGFELQMSTNYFGHFRLNAGMMDVLEASGGRIVPVSSVAHLNARMVIDDLNSKRKYNTFAAYGQSKLACLLYAFELERRLTARSSKVTTIPCHPGYAATNLQTTGVSLNGGGAVSRALWGLGNALFAQSPEKGAYSLTLAAAYPDARAGGYYGPTRFMDSLGPVRESRVAAMAQDKTLARHLWERTEDLVGPFFKSKSA